MSTAVAARAPVSSESVAVVDAPAGDWDAYVARRPDASAYYQRGWREVFEGAFGHETRYLAAVEQRQVVGVLPLVLFRSRVFGRFIVSLPFVNYGGVLADHDTAAAALLEEAGTIGRQGGFSHLELRHERRQFASLPCKQHKVAMRLPLPRSTEEAWEAMDRKVRNQIRKAEKSGLTASIGGLEYLDDFYAIFARNMRDLGTPVYGRELFHHVLTVFRDSAYVVIVRYQGKAIAGGIALCHGDTVETPWASSLVEHRALCPNHTLYWFVMQWAIARQLNVLDFGRSTPDEGTFRFKEQWGAVSSPLCWEYSLFGRSQMPDQSPKNPKFRTAIELWKRCPLWLTNTLGPRVVRSIP